MKNRSIIWLCIVGICAVAGCAKATTFLKFSSTGISPYGYVTSDEQELEIVCENGEFEIQFVRYFSDSTVVLSGQGCLYKTDWFTVKQVDRKRMVIHIDENTSQKERKISVECASTTRGLVGTSKTIMQLPYGQEVER